MAYILYLAIITEITLIQQFYDIFGLIISKFPHQQGKKTHHHIASVVHISAAEMAKVKVNPNRFILSSFANVYDTRCTLFRVEFSKI